MKLAVMQQLTNDDVKFFELMLQSNAVEPGLLFPLTLGPLATKLNQLLYDHFHGNGWKLNLVTGRYEKEAV